MIRRLSTFLVGLLSGLLAAGIVLLFLNRSPSFPIRLLPPPTPAPLRVHVTGAVLVPDVYSLPVGSILEAALEAAGGSLSEADLNRINLAAPLEDGQHIYIPFESETSLLPGTASSNPPPQNQRLNINVAAAADLERLPGIGPSLAQKIIEYRQEQGLFLTVDDLIKVSGIGPAKLEQIRELICCY